MSSLLSAASMCVRVLPAALCDHAIRIVRAPRAALVEVHGLRFLQHRSHDTPGLLDTVLTREQPGIAVDRVAQQAFVGLGALAEHGFVRHGQSERLAYHLVSRLLCLHPEGDPVVLPEAEAELV